MQGLSQGDRGGPYLWCFSVFDAPVFGIFSQRKRNTIIEVKCIPFSPLVKTEYKFEQKLIRNFL